MCTPSPPTTPTSYSSTSLQAGELLTKKKRKTYFSRWNTHTSYKNSVLLCVFIIIGMKNWAVHKNKVHYVRTWQITRHDDVHGMQKINKCWQGLRIKHTSLKNAEGWKKNIINFFCWFIRFPGFFRDSWVCVCAGERTTISWQLSMIQRWLHERTRLLPNQQIKNPG